LENRNKASPFSIDQRITFLQDGNPDFLSKRIDGISTFNKDNLIGWEVKLIDRTNYSTRYCNYTTDFDENGNSNHLTVNGPAMKGEEELNNKLKVIENEGQLVKSMHNQQLAYLADIKRSFSGYSSTIKTPKSFGRDKLIPFVDPSNAEKRIQFYSILFELVNSENDKYQKDLHFKIFPFEYNGEYILRLSDMKIIEEKKDLFHWKRDSTTNWKWKSEIRTVNWTKKIEWN
jgi:hypothetical protein